MDEPVQDSFQDSMQKPVRGPLPPALPRDVVDHPALCDEEGALRRVWRTVACPGARTRTLDHVSGTFRVVRHVRPKLSCWSLPHVKCIGQNETKALGSRGRSRPAKGKGRGSCVGFLFCCLSR